MKRVYRLTHLYNIGNQDIYFVSKEKFLTIIELAVFIQFRAEQIVDEGISLLTKEIADILFTYINVVEIPINNKEEAITIDMYHERETLCFHEVYNPLMKKYSELLDLKLLDEKLINTDSKKRFDKV